MTPFKQTTAALPSHPVQLTDAERALLNTLHDDDEPRSSSMVRASSGRLFAGPIGPWIYVIDASRIHRHRKTGGDLVIPSPDAAGFLSTKAKAAVFEFSVGKEDPTSTVFAYPERAHVWGADYVLDGDHVGVLFSDHDNITWLALCARREGQWREIDHARLPACTKLVSFGDLLVADSSKGNKLHVFGVRDGRLHKLGAHTRKPEGVIFALPADTHEGLYTGWINRARGKKITGLEDAWSQARVVKPKRDTHRLQRLSASPAVTSFEPAVFEARAADYERFVASGASVERFCGPTSRGFLAAYAKGVRRHVCVGKGDEFTAGPKLVFPGKRFEWLGEETARAAGIDVVQVAGASFIIP